MNEPFSVYIADDEVQSRRGIRDCIDWESLGTRVVGTGASGSDVLRYLKHHPIDLLISDIRMPVVDGIALLRELTAQQIDIMVILISAYDDFEYAYQAVKYKIVQDFFLKPLHQGELQQAVKLCVRELSERRLHSTLLRQIGPSGSGIYSPSRILDLRQQIMGHLQHGEYQLGLDEFSRTFDQLAGAGGLNVQRRFCVEMFGGICELLEKNDPGSWVLDLKRDELYDILNAREALALRQHLLALLEVAVAALHRAEEERQGYWGASVLRIIHQHCYEPDFNLQKLSDLLGLSPNYLSVKFKEEIGINFIKYLNGKRIEHAKELLANPRHKIYEVAGAVGIEDGRYFARIFKESTGCTPKEYREKHL